MTPPFEDRTEEGTRIERTDPCRQETRRWRACPERVSRVKINPRWISNISDVVVRDDFLKVCCAVDKNGNAWFPKWCPTHSRELLKQTEPEPTLWDSR